jgi:uncharacterized protein (DUF1330 family)
MTAYAIAHLRNPQLNADVVDYIDRIQGTLDPFGGRFIVHGGEVDVREGEWPGTIVIIEFHDADQAGAWYESAAAASSRIWAAPASASDAPATQNAE